MVRAPSHRCKHARQRLDRRPERHFRATVLDPADGRERVPEVERPIDRHRHARAFERRLAGHPPQAKHAARSKAKLCKGIEQ